MIRNTIRLAGALAILVTAGCNLDDEDNGGADGDGTGLAYSVPVLAPDACYVADEGQEVTTDPSGATIVKRVLRREDGICAQSMTEVVFSGNAPTTSDSGKVILQIVSPSGEVLNSFTLR